MSLMEFAIVNNYMGTVATKAMKGYSEENIAQTTQTGSGSKVSCLLFVCSLLTLLSPFFFHDDHESTTSYFSVFSLVIVS